MFDERVELGKESYAVTYAVDPFAAIEKALHPFLSKKILLITDDRVNEHYGKTIYTRLKSAGYQVFEHVFPSGESNKHIDNVLRVVNFALNNCWNRDDLFLVVGGGVVGDMGAFSASLCLRGVPLIHVPTTLLAAVDSAIGGKTGVNHAKGKNLMGTFYQPRQVIVSPYFFSTLDEREIRTGLAEVIKYAMIKSPSLFESLLGWLVAHPVKDFSSYPDDFWQRIIGECVHIKASIVGEDEKESGLRIILNYGHTFGHAIETLTHYNVYTHGEAIAIGMNMAALVAHGMGICESITVKAQQRLISLAGLPLVAKDLDIDKLFEVIKVDKKVKRGRLTLVLPEDIGAIRIETDIDEGEVRSVLEDVLQ